MKHLNNHCIKKDIPAWIQVFATVWYAFVANVVASFVYSIYCLLISIFYGYELDQTIGYSIVNIIIYFVIFGETIPLSTLFLSVLHYFKVIEYCIYSKTIVAIESVIMMIFADIYYSHYYMYNRFCYFTVIFVVLLLILLIIKNIFKNKYDILRNKFTESYTIDVKKNKWHATFESMAVYTILLIWTLISAYLSPN